jgi:hypothetical protein
MRVALQKQALVLFSFCLLEGTNLHCAVSDCFYFCSLLLCISIKQVASSARKNGIYGLTQLTLTILAFMFERNSQHL